MAKKKQKKSAGGKAAKSGTPRLPKRVAGIKVPKELREPGGKLLEAVRHPLVMDVAAAALIAAAAGLRNAGTASASARRSDAPKPKPDGDLGALLTAAALEGVRRLGDAAGRKGNGNGSAPGKVGGD